MAVVEPLWPRARREEPEPEERVNVVRLVAFLGPVSPELVLVDPELGERARALLPDAPGVRVARRLSRVEPVPPLEPLLATTRRIEPRVLIAALVAGVAVAASGSGWWAATALQHREPAIESPRTVAAPPLPTTELLVSPLPTSSTTPSPNRPKSQTQTTSRPSPNLGPPAGAPAPPRFVWPAEPGAERYRVALFRDGRRIFERDVGQPAVQLPRSWTYENRLYTLTKGPYRWVVWPLVGTGSGVRPGAAIVSAVYVV